MTAILLIIAVVWASSMVIVVVVAISMDEVSCLAEAGATRAEDAAVLGIEASGGIVGHPGGIGSQGRPLPTP